MLKSAMNTRPHITTEGALDEHQLATDLHDLAMEVEEAERRIKEALLRAAEEGDLHRVKAIVRQWLAGPATAVVANLDPPAAP